MATKRKPKPATMVTLTVCSGRVVDGHRYGETFTVDLGPEPDAESVDYDPHVAASREADIRQIRGWIHGEHVRVTAGGELIDPVYANAAKDGD